MNGISLLLDIDMTVMVVLSIVLILSVNSEQWGRVVPMEWVTYWLLGATTLALALVSLLKFVRMEG